MKIIDKLSYAVWVYNNETSTTEGFYKVTGSDFKDALPTIVTFNKQMAGKVEVQDPMPWGAARAHTWKCIKDNKFDQASFGFPHLAPDGANMTDDDMRDYWIPGSDCGDSASAGERADLLAHLRDLSWGFSDAVFELAQFVVSMYPEREKKDLWTGVNFILCANEVVRVLQALPAVILDSLLDTATFSMNNGPDIEGVLVAGGKCQLVVTTAGVWSIELTDHGPVGKRLTLKTHDPNGRIDGVDGTIDPADGTWFAMPTAEDVLRTIANGPYKRKLDDKARAEVAKAIDAMHGAGPANVTKVQQADDGDGVTELRREATRLMREAQRLQTREAFLAASVALNKALDEIRGQAS